jgi:hypothetical protein
VEAALEIRPLLLYYGFLAFARATVISRTGHRLSTLRRGHGLKDKLKDGGRLTDAAVAVHGMGTFSEFNDVARLFSCVPCRSGDGKPETSRFRRARQKNFKAVFGTFKNCSHAFLRSELCARLHSVNDRAFFLSGL